MRVSTLELARYGAFENRSVDFGTGLSLVLGGNETGKSTTLDALADLLWSIPFHSSRSFRFSRQALVLRATLLLPDEAELRVERVASGLSDIATGAGITAVWQGDGDDRTLWKTSFGLSHEALRAGGRDLCRAKGDLASLIFQARSGHSVDDILEDLSARADALYKSHRNNRNVEARRALAEYQDAVAETEQAMARAHHVMDVRAAMERAAGDLALRRAESERARTDHDTWSAKLRVAGEVRDLAQVRAHAAELRAAGPCLSGEDLVAWDEVTDRLQILDDDMADIERQREEVFEQSAAVTVEHDVLTEQSAITLLAHECTARVEGMATAENAQSGADLLDGEARALISGLTGDDDLLVEDGLSRLWLGEDRIAELDAVAAELHDADKALVMAEEKLSAARDQEAADSSDPASTPPASIAALREALGSLKATGSALTAFDEALGAAHEATSERAELLTRAGLPVHTTLGAVPSPGTVKTSGDRLVACEEAVRAARSASAIAAQRVDELEQRLRASGDHDVPALTALVDARAERDRLIDDVVRAWVTGALASDTPGLPVAAERAVRQADRVADLLSEHREAAAARAGLATQATAARVEAADAAMAIDAAVSALAAAWQEWTAVWQPAGVVAPPPPEAIAHRALLVDALAAEGRAGAARDLVENLRPQVEQLRTYLTEVLARAGRPRPGADMDSLLTAAEEVLVEDADARGSRAVAERMRKLREAAQLGRDRASTIRDSIDARWKSALTAVGLPMLSPTGWYRRRDVAAQARELHTDANRHRDEARALRERYQSFTGELTRVTALLGIDVAADPAGTTALLADRLQAAQQAKTRSDDFEARLAALEKGIEHTAQQRQSTLDELADLEHRAGTGDLDQAAGRGRRLADLEERVAKHTEVIGAALPDLDVEQLVSELADVDAESLHFAAESAERLAHAAGEAHERAFADHVRLKQQYRELTTRPGAAELHARAEEKLAALAEHVEEYLVVEIQRTVLRAELDAYERKHASPLLDAAGRILEQLTGGRYVGLRPLHGKDGRSLRIVGADEQAHAPDELSEGTADQAFLALRLAGIASLQESRVARGLPTLPVVLDDVLMTFDDARAAAAIRVMAGLAERWQIIVLSHHTHIRQVAVGLGLANVTVSELVTPAVLEPTRAAEDVRAAIREGTALEQVAPVHTSRAGLAQDLTAVRVWARQNGFQVKERGRVPNDVIKAYEAANA
ncbi:AAA family ATPase [Saccharothrix sp. NRRL B-16314]|uniref:AAA family ATPase n=1 Tax=Saccharothrix sp. NRRL B-16314 TaxID=1463825 RepID=UPI000525AA8D|nr:histone-like nucleoid-structuring protein Lsr2 [Saccharothrix sp. NRRL B-16314]